MANTWKLGTYVAIQCVVAAGSFALPTSAGAIVRLSVAAAAISVLVVAILRRRPHRPVGWWLIALSGALTLATALTIVARYGHVTGLRLASLPKLLLVVLALLAFAAGLAVLGWRGTGRWNTLDTAVTATAAFLVTWVLYIEPSLARVASGFATVVAVTIPAAALLAFAMAVKLAFCGAVSTWSGRLLLLATASGLCTAVLIVEPIGAPTVSISLPVTVSWLAQAILLGAAALAPGFRGVVGPQRHPVTMELPSGRIVLFVVLALVAPLNVAVGVMRSDTPGPVLAAIILPPVCGTLILLILVIRLALLAKVARHRADELGARSASLAAALARQDELQGELAYRAEHDPLTGLANRDVLTERIEALPSSRRGARGVSGHALMMVDLDGFKGINDTLGHPAGDQVLVDVSRRMVSRLPDATVVARLGGDEFVALLANTTMERARWAAEEVTDALRVPYRVAGHDIELTASVGLLIIEPPAQPVRFAEALRQADRALYAAKAAGGNRVHEVRAGSHAERATTDAAAF